VRFIWTVAGDDPGYDNCRAHGINGLYAPLFDTLTTKAYLSTFKAEGFANGLYLGHNWFPALSGSALVAKVVAEYKRIALPDTRLMLNLEEHDPAKIALVVSAVRAALPKVNLSWSPEGMQGGWMSPEFVAQILAARCRVVPQAFLGNMTRIESDQVLRDLTRRGFPEHIISIFYDAAALGHNWDGFAFTEGRLPWLL
jgi:hypothetical protein